MFSCGKSCPGNCLFAQVVIPDFEGGDELKESSEVKGSLGPTGFRSAQGSSNWRGRSIERTSWEAS